MTTSRAAFPAFLLVLACAPDGRPPGQPARPASGGGPTTGPPLPACELVRLFEAARRESATEMTELVLALPAGSREFEARWVLDRGSPAQAARVIEALEPAEVPPLRAALIRRASEPRPEARDPALLALTEAGVAAVQPMVARALRTESSERSLAALARAAGQLGPFLPVAALKTALSRARTGPALVAITAALGAALDAEALRILASRGPAAGEALEAALRVLRAPQDPGPPAPQQPAEESCRPGGRRSGTRRRESSLGALAPDAVAILRARAAEIAELDADRERTLVSWLGERLEARGPWAVAAAEALGAIGSRAAAAELARALDQADRPLAAAISSALASALRMAPARTPANPRELRRAWFPIVATLFPDENEGPSNRP